MNNFLSVQPELLFAEGKVEFHSQPIGLVVAQTEAEAAAAARMVKIEYTDVRKPILTIDDALEAKSFLSHPLLSDKTKGDAETAIKNSKHQIAGEYHLNSTQYNFFLEVIVSL
jgi:xanthine dehydrogenase/oxidase